MHCSCYYVILHQLENDYFYSIRVVLGDDLLFIFKNYFNTAVTFI